MHPSGSEPDDVLKLVRTPADIIQSWELEYENNPQTNWERLPLDDQSRFISELNGLLGEVHSVLDIGCGRGYRTLLMLSQLASLNRVDVDVTAIDISSKAITKAKLILTELKNGHVISKPLADALRGKNLKLNCSLSFEAVDVLDLPASDSDRKYDLVIDWMCFHDLSPSLYEAYVEKIEKLCNRWFVLNTFCRDTSEFVHKLGDAVPGVRKYWFDDHDIQHIFPHFEIMIKKDTCQEILNPDPPHSDGPVVAKRAYLLRRL